MTMIPITLPPGVYKNGTPYAARGRWADSNLVRWHDDAARPIGGWSFRAVLSDTAVSETPNLPSTETARDIISYRDTAGRTQTLIGTNERLFRMDEGNTITDITPAGFVGGANTVVNLVGYGIGKYGVGSYGTTRNIDDAKPDPVPRWNFDTYGENVIATFSNGEGTWDYVPAAANAVALANVPDDIIDTIVTDERIVMGIRNGPNDIREVIWSDREDATDWTPTATNYAGSQVLQGSGDFVGIYKVQNQVLILSQTDAQVGNFLGAPFVYGFNRVGQNCQPIDAKAVVSTGRFAMWLGLRSFWMYDGTLAPVPSDITDFLALDMDQREVSKMSSFTVSAFSEIWWLYQSTSSSEVDSYFTFNYRSNHWTTGRLPRTAGFDRGALNSPIMITPEGTIYTHEQDAALVEGAYLTTGPLELSNGQKNMAVRYVFVDTQEPDSIELSFTTKQSPNSVAVSHGPYTQREPVSTTGVLGREVRMTVTGLTNNWELGTMRFDVQEVGGGFR